MAEPHDDPVQRASDLLADAASVAVGLGVLAVNRAQSLRRQLTQRLVASHDADRRRAAHGAGEGDARGADEGDDSQGGGRSGPPAS